MFCKYCGERLGENADVCLKCGKIQNGNVEGGVLRVQSEEQYSNKSRVVAGLLALFLGLIGAHNFYLGKYGCAIGQIVLMSVIVAVPFLLGGLGKASGETEMALGLFGGWLLSLCLFAGLFFWVLIEMICCFAGTYKDSENKRLK